MLKCSPGFGRAIRGLLGTAEAPALDIKTLHELAREESVLMLGLGGINPDLPGEQKSVTRSTLESVVHREPKGRLIVLHCA